MAGILDSFLDLFRPRQVIDPNETPIKVHELSTGDYQSRREMYPLVPASGWDRNAILQMLENQDIGNFQMSEQFYHACRKEALIAAALDMRRQLAEFFDFELKVPKESPDEVHVLTDLLAKEWQSVMPDHVRGEIVERVNFFGFQVCRIQWIWKGAQKIPRLIPYTHSSLSWRQDLWCYQGMSERGLEYIRNDGREWVIFSLGGTRPWLRGLIRPLAFIFFGLISGDDRWLGFNDQFANPMRIHYTPRIMREQREVQKDYDKVNLMRGGDLVLCPREDKDKGYDFRYEQVNASGFQTFDSQLTRLDERAAILILGHNLLQSVKGGSLAAMREAMSLLRVKGIADMKVLQTGFETISKVWAKANFGENPDDFPELGGQPIELYSWSLVYDISDPEQEKQKAEQAKLYAGGFATFAKAAGPKLYELPIDWEEAAEKSGIPMLSGEDGYDQDDTDTQLAAEEWISPPEHVKAAARRALAWVQEFKRGGTERGRGMARKIARGRLSRNDVLAISRYWPRHAIDAKGKNWDNLKRPSNGRIAWGLWGDSGDGRGRKWSEREAERIRGSLHTSESETFHKKTVPLGLNAPLIQTLGKSQRAKDAIGIASVAAFDLNGRLLMGKRSDTGKYTMPGGHLEPGESPMDGAKRELFEEAGLSGNLVYIGSGQTGNYLVHAFRLDGVSTAPTSDGDPDGEVGTWEWITLPLSEEINSNLHAPRNVTLALLGLGSDEGMTLVRSSK